MMKILKRIFPKNVFQSAGLSQASIDKLLKSSTLTTEEIFDSFSTSITGLDEDGVEKKTKEFGLNLIQREQAPSWVKQLIAAFINPFIGILVIIAIISFIIDVWIAKAGDEDYKTVIVILAMVLISVFLRFIQEFKSNLAAEKLNKMVTTTATVVREGKGAHEIDFEEIVPGDIIRISAGDMIPVDARIIQSKDLFVNQTMLTGESLPVEKTSNVINNISNKPLHELENICLMGTNVLSGSAIIVAINTGSNTYFGAISKSVTEKRADTSFDKGINKISWLLIRYMLVMVPLVFLINGVMKGDWLEALLFAIAVAVGLTPEMLPMIVTTNLAKGSVNMSKYKVIVKRLNAIQNIGAMNVLCTDKTGTLTLDNIVLEKYVNIMGFEDDEVLSWAYLNSFYQTGVESLMDNAILKHAELYEELKIEDFEKLDEIPFDFNRRRLSVILEKNDGQHLLICKGAVEEMLDICSYAFDPAEDEKLQIFTDEIIPLDTKTRDLILREANKMNEDGIRVLLLAVREFDPRPLDYGVNDESDLVVVGLIGFLDPAKPSANQAIAKLHDLGVDVKVLTGDNEIVTKKICKDVGIPINKIVLGTELDDISDEDLIRDIDDISIFAKLNPFQKSRIVKILQAKGHTVGFLGDGINDAGALKDADVGISVDTAVDIAKESSDIILLENDLAVLKNGVVIGRRTFGNILKYIKMTTSSNFGNMFSMLGASAFLPFLPMLPAQLLLQNLLYDVSQISIPWDRVDDEYINKPQQWDTSFLSKFILYIGPISSIFDYATFALMFFFFKANSPDHQALFQTGWFVEGLLSQTLIVHLIRTRKIPFIQSWATAPVVALTSLIMAIGIIIPFTPIASMFGMVPLPILYFPFLIIILTAYALLTQVVKNWFVRRYNVF
ncbi:MAG: magnesium-translocating P-type ATPase [Bacteroidales bacterium]|nr:magnesium-translocating P-type ATPase [Bacteroidales bacterium]MDD4684450.1 magnesium-translocating P-type ATPase [Bacteroidales bacterium]